jgi:hypothetical protein
MLGILGRESIQNWMLAHHSVLNTLVPLLADVGMQRLHVDRYQAEDVFARVPQMAERIDPVLKELDQLLDDDALYRQVRVDFGKRYRYTLVHGRHSTPVEVLLRMLIVKHLHQ